MKIKIGFGRSALVLAFFFVAMLPSTGSDLGMPSIAKYLVDDAVASTDGTPKWIAEGTPGIGILSWSCDRNYRASVISFGNSADDCIAQGFGGFNGYLDGFQGWEPGWAMYWTAGDCHPNEFVFCVYPRYSQYASYIVPAQKTEEKGSKCLIKLADTDAANFEQIVGIDPNNITALNSSIDLKSGNVFHSQQVGPLTFSFNSIDSGNGPLGPRWTHDFNIYIIPNSDSGLFLKHVDGNRIWFKPVSMNTYHADEKSGDTSSIVKNTDGSYARTTRYGKVYNFDSSGKLTSIADRNGNVTTLTYTGSDLTGITDSTGRTVGIGVSGGKIISVKDFLGKTSTITYSPAGLIASIADPLGNTWNFQYDSSNRMVQKTDPSNNVVTYTYDATSGRLTSSTDPNNITKSIAYDTTNAISTVTEKDGGVWVHKYDPIFNVPLQTTDPYGNNTTYAYDSNNNLLSITYPDGTSKSFTYDANRNVTSQTDPGGRTTTLTYNSQNRLTDSLDPAGRTTHVTYDAKGNLSSYKDPTGALTQIQRDTRGNITSVTDPLGHAITYGYDQYNNGKRSDKPTFSEDLIRGNIFKLKTLEL